MGGCCVPGCSNSSDKKFRMATFPRDPERRQKWIQNIGRKNWTPTKHNCICEVHFEKHMWEKTRVNGPEVMKKTAIPTLFLNRNPGKLTEEEQNVKINMHHTHFKLQEQFTHNKVTYDERAQKQNDEEVEIESLSFPNQRNVNIIPEATLLNTKRNIITLNDEEKFKRANHLIAKQQKLIQYYKKVNRQLRNKNQSPTSNDYKKILESLFNTDQIQQLKMRLNNGKKVKYWSDETIRDALQLKQVCGTRGYEEFLKRGFPYPSLRSLRDRQEKFKQIQ